MTTAAVVLAAGAGSRFAGDGHKLLAVVRGRPVVAWAIGAAVDAALDATAIVIGAVDLDHIVTPGVVVLHNAGWERRHRLLAAARGDVGRRAANTTRSSSAWPTNRSSRATAWRAVAAAPHPIAVATYDGQRRNPVRLAADGVAAAAGHRRRGGAGPDARKARPGGTR